MVDIILGLMLFIPFACLCVLGTLKILCALVQTASKLIRTLNKELVCYENDLKEHRRIVSAYGRMSFGPDHSLETPKIVCVRYTEKD